MRNGKVFRTEGNIILGNGGDDLIFRMLENRPDTMPGATVSVSVRTAFIEYVVSQQRDMSGIGCGKRMVRFTPSSAQVAPES